MGFGADRHVVLVGMPGSGKTTVGRQVAERLGRPFVDSDEQIAARYGRSGRELAASAGVTALHRAEAEALQEALASPRPAVVAAAASVGDDPAVAASLEQAVVVLLAADPAVLADRQGTGPHRRPLDRETLAELSARRRPVYLGHAHLVVDTSAVPPDAAAAAIAALVEA